MRRAAHLLRRRAAVNWDGRLKTVLLARCYGDADPPDGDETGRKRVDEVGDPHRSKLLSKVEMPYRPVRGVNVPYPKIPTDMEHYIFKEMETCEEIEDSIYELWDRLTLREVDAAFFALKRMNAYPPTSLLERLSQKTMELSEQITGRNVSSLFLTAARLKFFSPALFNSLATEVMKEEKLQDCQAVFCGTIVYAMGALQRYFARARPHVDEGIELYFPLQLQLVEAMSRRILTVRDEAGLTNKNIGNFFYGLAMMKYRDEALLNVLSEEATRAERFSVYGEQEVSNIIYSFGLLNYKNDRLLSQFCDILRDAKRLEHWSEQGLSNTIYGFALLRYRPPNETVLALIWEICKAHRLEKFYNQHLMNAIYGLAILGIRSYRVFKCLVDELLKRRHKFEFMLTGLSSIVYSFALAGIYTESVKTLLEDLTSARNLSQITNWSLTNLIHAIGLFPDDAELLPFLQKLVEEAVNGERLAGFGERHFALILYGMSVTGLRKNLDPVHLVQLIWGATSPGLLPTYTDQGLANTVFAITHLGYVEQESHGRLAAEAAKRVPKLAGVPLASLVYSWGLVPYRHDAFVHAVVQRLMQTGVVEQYTEQILSNLLFGLLRLGVRDGDAFRLLVQRIQQPGIWEKFANVTAPSRIEELLRSDVIDGRFRERLSENLLHNTEGRKNRQLKHM